MATGSKRCHCEPKPWAEAPSEAKR